MLFNFLFYFVLALLLGDHNWFLCCKKQGDLCPKPFSLLGNRLIHKAVTMVDNKNVISVQFVSGAGIPLLV
jgi:hypothetical protein